MAGQTRTEAQQVACGTAAELLGVRLATVKRDWALAWAWLHRALQD